MLFPRNTSPITHWVWEYIWLLDSSYYTLEALPHVALETEALRADPGNKDPRFYLDYVIVGENGSVFVHMERPVKH